MIKDEVMRRGGREEEMVRLAQLGKIETILGHKENLVLNQLFKSLKECYNLPKTKRKPKPPPPPPPPSPSLPLPLRTSHDPINSLDLLSLLRPNPRTILIEGAPGGGKSTLTLHICHQWAQGASWLAKFDVVVLAHLRDEAIQNASTLADILPAAGDILKLSQSQNIVSHMQASYGKGIIFILDGWDEFPQHLMEDSFVSTIIRQPHKLSLNLSTILITSRPVASGNLLHIADRRVEILGFTQHQIHTYIEKSLDGNSTRIQKLFQHLEEHPVIEGYCYVPLHSAILVHIFLTMKEALPITLHELFCSLVLCCIVREQATHEPNSYLPELFSLDDLPDNLKSKLSNLSVLAYKGVMQDKIVFYSKDLQASCLPSDLPSLGLLQAVEGLTLYSTSRSYNFLHLSVQELLAAYHISKMNSSEQVKVFKELFGSSRFQAVLHYYCGFTKLDNPEIQEFISSYHHNKYHLKELLPLLHCFFEAQQPSLSQLIDPTRFLSNESSVAGLIPVDFLAIGYFITSFLSTSTATSTVTLHLIIRDNIDDHCLKLLLIELSKHPIGGLPTSAGALSEKLVLKLHKPSTTRLKYMASQLKTFPIIIQLELIDVNIQSTSVLLQIIGETLQANSSLTKLRIRYIGEQDSVLIKCLHLNKPVTELDLSSNHELTDSGARCIIERLQHNTSVVNLNLSNTGITATDPDTARCLTEMLQINNSLTHLNLSQLKNFSDSGAYCVFKGLQHNTTLVNLNLSNCDITATDPDTARSLTEMLQINNSLTHLNLSQLKNFSDLGAYCVFKGLQHNTTLVNLNLSNCDITATDPDTARSLTEMLQINNSLTHLNLSQLKNFSDSGAYCVFKGLQHNTNLMNLNLSNCDITATDPDTARSLTKMLQINNSLTHLNLSRNDRFSESGARCIFEGLEHISTLVYLNLCRTNITATDPDTARSLTEMLKVNNSLTHLNLSQLKNFSDSGACCVFKGLQHNTTLVNLNLSNCDITATDPDTARSLNKMLLVNKSLTHLNLSENNTFSDSGARCIFEGLQHNSTLVYLNFGRTNITATDPDTARSLTKMLQINKSLTHLDLSGNNGFSDSGARCIFESLQHNSTLIYLNLGETSITATDPDIARSLTKMLQVNKSLTHLDLSCKVTIPANQIISHIFFALEHNTTLLHIVLQGREISNVDDAEYVVRALKSNRYLLSIDITHAYISGACLQFILASLKFNSFSKTIYISYNDTASAAVRDFQKARQDIGLPPVDIVLRDSFMNNSLHSQKVVQSIANRKRL